MLLEKYDLGLNVFLGNSLHFVPGSSLTQYFMSRARVLYLLLLRIIHEYYTNTVLLLFKGILWSPVKPVTLTYYLSTAM